MQTVPVGKTPLRSSRLVYGGWRIAGTQDATAVTADARKSGIAALQAAYEAGYTGFDLADVYCGGVCEEILGEALRQTPGMRDGILLATKCGIRVPGVPAGAPYRYDFSADYITASVDVALRRMGVSHIDLLMLHRPDFLMDPSEVAEAFGRLRGDGKVREFGVSNFRPAQVDLLQQFLGFPLAVHQVEVSLRQLATLSDGTLDQCLSKGISPMAWSPLGGSGPESFNPAVFRLLAGIGESLGVAPEVVAVAWLLRHPSGILPVVGSTKPERIRRLARAAGIRLERDDWYRLLEAALGARLP
jgi:predicted oxidoreductase